MPRQLVWELIEVSEKICSVKLRQSQPVSTTEAKKNLFADLLASDVVLP